MMSKILALGTGPLLEGGVKAFGAHCLRSWHLTSALLEAGHEVALFTLPINSGDPQSQEHAGVEDKRYRDFSYRAFLNNDDQHNLNHLNRFAEQFQPGALLGINSYGAWLMSKLHCPAPMWADFYGWVMTEGAVKSARCGDDELMGRYWEMEQGPLARADKFSAVSMPQLHALHGELAAAGRLNRHTAAYDFAARIPSAYDPFHAQAPSPAGGAISLRGGVVPDGAFALLWSGGYNSWSNFDVVADALEIAMRQRPELHYVSTGGAYFGHDEISYARFCERVQASEFRERFHLLGWVDANELPGLYAQADLGLCADSKNLESVFGARTRIVNMAASGLPVLVTLGTEISEILTGAGCALGRRQDDAADLAEGIVDACSRRGELKALGEKGREYVLRHFSFATTAAPLLEWAEHPEHAPDNREPAPSEKALGAQESSAAPAAPGGAFEPLKRWAEATLGRQTYGKLRHLRQRWRS